MGKTLTGKILTCGLKLTTSLINSLCRWKLIQYKNIFIKNIYIYIYIKFNPSIAAYSNNLLVTTRNFNPVWFFYFIYLFNARIPNSSLTQHINSLMQQSWCRCLHKNTLDLQWRLEMQLGAQPQMPQQLLQLS